MKKDTRFVGLDVHVSSISVAVAEEGRSGEVRFVGHIDNRPDAVRKLVKKIGKGFELHCCYEAGPCGYVLYRQLKSMGVRCDVVAPSLIPRKTGDRVKTDRRDAEGLARMHRAGDLTKVWVPDETHEALRDLVRARESVVKQVLAAKQRVRHLLLRAGIEKPGSLTTWSWKHREWLRSVKFEHSSRDSAFACYLEDLEHHLGRLDRIEEAIDDALELAAPEIRAVVSTLESFRGIGRVTAATLVSEIGQFLRFEHPREVMGYVGLVPSEHSSGGPKGTRRFGITKTGNAHLRRVLIEAAWHYRHRPYVGHSLRKRQAAVPDQVKEQSLRAQRRLNARYHRLHGRGKPLQVATTAVARELVGFLWAAAVATEVEFLAAQ